ncbi:MoaD/ThiS family protein [Streptomyces griseus]|uniref:MoaD/ThiS family protein n=1 Tax=Streptomyces griseus TaxID=1911 RepID=UPI00380AC177
MDDVRIDIPSSLAQFTGGVKSFSVRGGTVRQVLENMHSAFPLLVGRVVDTAFQPLPFVRVYVGDEDVRNLRPEDAAVVPGSTVMILAAVAGG